MSSLAQQAEAARRIVRDNRAGLHILGLKEVTPVRILPLQRDTLVLWSMHNGWSREVASKYSGLSPNTIRRGWERFRLQPWLIFSIPILHRGVIGKRPLWRCEVCLARMPNLIERKAREHVARHFISPAQIEMNGVMDPWGD